MKDQSAYFKGKKITVMGLGLLGRGIGDTAFLAECEAELIVTDMKSADVLAESLEQLSMYPNITYVLGEHREEDFRGRDMILKAAGVPLDSQYIEMARKDGAEIVMSGALFAKLSGIPIIGITGTRGKSTVTHMIHHVLSQMTEGGNVILGGNVRGVSNLQLLKDVTEDSIAVMELDSWQLQGFGELNISPQIAIFTSFMEDHLNYYRGSMESYFADKAHIFMHQDDSDVFITTRDVFERAVAYGKKEGRELTQDVHLVDVSLLPDDCMLSMPGEHNRLNAALALEALRATGLTDEEIFEGLATFPGVPGRLEYLGEKDGIRIYNDNNATTPTATAAGLKAFGEVAGDKKRIILIMGGAGKELDMTPLLEAIPQYCKNVILLPGTGTDELTPHLSNLPFEWKVAEGTSSDEVMNNTTKLALAEGREGDIVLFSPAFASFGMFKNEYDRGDRFVATVNEILARD